MRKHENEKNACDAFIEILQKITGVEYYPESWPEYENRNVQDVEVILAPKDRNTKVPKIAVEHTIIEAHERQIAYVHQSYDIVEKINQRCKGKLPTDRFFLLVIPPALAKGTKDEINQLIAEISCWIPDIAKTLRKDQWASQPYKEYKVLLQCGGSYSGMNGKIGRMPTRPKEAEKERQDRFRKAIEDKLPKLIKYKEKQKYATALLLEDLSGVHMHPKDNWIDLIPCQYQSEFQLKIDYVVIFVSNEKRMIVGNVWKEKSQLYSEIPDNRKFSFNR